MVAHAGAACRGFLGGRRRAGRDAGGIGPASSSARADRASPRRTPRRPRASRRRPSSWSGARPAAAAARPALTLIGPGWRAVLPLTSACPTDLRMGRGVLRARLRLAGRVQPRRRGADRWGVPRARRRDPPPGFRERPPLRQRRPAQRADQRGHRRGARPVRVRLGGLRHRLPRPRRQADPRGHSRLRGLGRADPVHVVGLRAVELALLVAKTVTGRPNVISRDSPTTAGRMERSR